ncbi:MAG: type II toxin-antitoxin system VapC family toxin [Bryobacteraceae bacterium]
MAIDTSAVLAILQREPERRSFLEAIEAADSTRMSVASFVEVSMVIESRYGAEGLRDLDRFISRAAIELIPMDREQGHVARSAFSHSERDAIAPDSTTAIASRTQPPSV